MRSIQWNYDCVHLDLLIFLIILCVILYTLLTRPFHVFVSKKDGDLTEEGNYVYNDDLGDDNEGVLPTHLVEPITHAHIYISNND